MQRRNFLKLGLAGLLLGPTRLLAADGTQRLLSCCSDNARNHYLAMLDTDGNILMQLQLPARGHGISVDPQHGIAAVFARRPGSFVWLVDLSSGEVIHKLQAAAGRHYYGHGVFSPDGDTLLCSENAFESGDGVIGTYQRQDGWQRVGEFASHGIGPHEFRLLSDGETLVIANGGIRTHPDLPRIKSNLAQMRPNLAYVNRHDGRLLHRHEPPVHWHQLSIRHLDVSADDRVAIAMQYEGNPLQRPPLIALHQFDHRGDADLQLLQAPQQVQARLRNYCGSVRFSQDGARFAVSSPRGGLVTLWSSDGDYLGAHQQADVCGIAVQREGFVLSDGSGAQQRLTGLSQASLLSQDRQLHWDNHQLEV